MRGGMDVDGKTLISIAVSGGEMRGEKKRDEELGVDLGFVWVGRVC